MKRILFTAVLGLALLAAGCRFGAPKPTYSDGYRVGRIEKFSRKGFFYKTWEGRLLLQGYDRDGDGNMVVRLFQFSVLPKDEALVPKLEEAMISNKPVKLHYHEDWMGQWRYDSGYFVDAVE